VPARAGAIQPHVGNLAVKADIHALQSENLEDREAGPGLGKLKRRLSHPTPGALAAALFTPMSHVESRVVDTSLFAVRCFGLSFGILREICPS
jgi:hypothetical protein